jgi:hypothetical protein
MHDFVPDGSVHMAKSQEKKYKIMTSRYRASQQDQFRQQAPPNQAYGSSRASGIFTLFQEKRFYFVQLFDNQRYSKQN